jgi:hypothetical protein
MARNGGGGDTATLILDLGTRKGGPPQAMDALPLDEKAPLTH